MTAEGRLLLILSRVEGRDAWFLPGGSPEWAESLREAAERELREETGVVARVEGPIGLIESVSPDRTFHSLETVFRAQLPSIVPIEPFEVQGGIGGDGNEYAIEARWFTPGELADVPAYPAILLQRLLPAGGANLETAAYGYLIDEWPDVDAAAGGA